MHRSDHAERCFSDLLSNVSPTHWAASQEGLVPITDSSLLHQLEDLLTGTHKSDSDNWTRDRGCSLHGVNACSAACASKHRSPVPSGYRLVTATAIRTSTYGKSTCSVRMQSVKNAGSKKLYLFNR
jgi:hypothetical protein